MKNSLIKKSFSRVSIAHGIVILLTLFLPLFRGCAPKKHDVVTFIDLSGAPAPAPAPEPEETPKPAVESKPEPKPEPKPKPEKKPALEPAKTNTPPKKAETNPPPKKVETKKPAVTNSPLKKAETNAPPKPKTEAEKLAAIRQNNPVKRPAAKAAPALDYSGLKSALNSAATSSGATYGSGSGSGGGVYSPFAGYYDQVKQQLYSVWQQPAGAPVGLTAEATLRVERDGTVSSKSITRRSGNMLFDQSVQNALNDTTRLPAPPADLPNRTIDVEFALSN